MLFWSIETDMQPRLLSAAIMVNFVGNWLYSLRGPKILRHSLEPLSWPSGMISIVLEISFPD